MSSVPDRYTLRLCCVRDHELIVWEEKGGNASRTTTKTKTEKTTKTSVVGRKRQRRVSPADKDHNKRDSSSSSSSATTQHDLITTELSPPTETTTSTRRSRRIKNVSSAFKEQQQQQHPANNNVRRSSSKQSTSLSLFTISEKSPCLVQAQKLLAENQGDVSKCLFAPKTTTNNNNETTRMVQYALMGAIQNGDAIESIHILSKKNSILIRRLPIPRLHHLLLLLTQPKNYPMNLVLVRKCTNSTSEIIDGCKTEQPIVRSGKRRKRNTKKEPKSPPDVIEIISSDEESDAEAAAAAAAAGPQQAPKKARIEVVDTALPPKSSSLARSENASNTTASSPWKALPDPVPVFETYEFVDTSIGPAEVLSSRIDRLLPDSSSNSNSNGRHMPYHQPIVTYKLRLPFGTMFAPSTQLVPWETSERGCCTILSRNNFQVQGQGVTIRESDLVRLWPGVYLNDSLVNFYLKYLQQNTVPATATAAASKDIFVFPSYFYTRIATKDIRNSTNRKKNSQDRRQELWNSLSSWTKNDDILTKRFLMIPIHYELHWSLVLVYQPGAVLSSLDNSSHNTSNDEGNDSNPVEMPHKQGDATLEKMTNSSNNQDGAKNRPDPSKNQEETKLSRRSSPKCCILHCDSGRHFRLHRASLMFKHIRKYLTACLEATRTNINLEYTGENMPGFSPVVPSQDNETDCGLYMLEMIERFLKEAPLELDESFFEKKTGSPFGKDWFQKEDIEQKRKHMKSLIYQLSRDGDKNNSSKEKA